MISLWDLKIAMIALLVGIIGATIISTAIGLLLWWNTGAFSINITIYALLTVTLTVVCLLGAASNDEQEVTA